MNYAYEVDGEFVTKKVYDHVVEINEKVSNLEEIIQDLHDKSGGSEDSYFYHYVEKCSEMHGLVNEKEELEKQLADYKEWMTEPIVKFQTEFQEMKKELAELKDATRWRSVEEDPEECQECLVIREGEGMEMGMYSNRGYHCASGYYSDVTHWMPLPKGGE